MSTVETPANLTDEDILKAFKWGKPNETSTKRGPRILRKAPAQPEAMEFWRLNKSALAAAGVTYGLKWKSETEFEFCWWQPIPQEVIQQREANKDLSRATDFDIEIPSPNGKEYLPYQKAGVAFIRDKKGALLGDEMGLGKTIQGIGVINFVPEVHRVLVVCPQKLKLNWYRELRSWLVKPLSIGIAESHVFPSTDIVIINFDILHKWQAKMNGFWWDLLVIDEAHLIKNPKARRTQCVIGYRPRRDEPASMAKSGIPAKRRLAMTGTPICNKREELWPIVSYLDPITFNNWWRFNVKMSLDEVQEMLRSTIMIRRLKKDVLKDLPPKRRTIIPLEPDDNAREFIAREKAAMADKEDRMCALEAAVELAKASDDQSAYAAAVKALREGVQVSFEEISRIRHETALAKLPMATEYIEGMLEETDKLMILAHHRDVIDQLQKSFQSYGALKIYGGMSAIESQRAVDLFQNSPNHKVIILSISVAVGMTLTAASNAVAVELDWVPGKMSQAEDRIHRIGQQDSVNIYHLVLEGSLDQNMAITLVDKQEIIDRALDRVKAEGEAEEPVTPFSARRPRFTRESLAKEAEKITQMQIDAIHDALRALAGMCDGARQHDGSGFNKIDARVGHSLADQMFLTPKQAALGRKIIVKYQRQLPPSLLDSAGINAK